MLLTEMVCAQAEEVGFGSVSHVEFQEVTDHSVRNVSQTVGNAGPDSMGEFGSREVELIG